MTPRTWGGGVNKKDNPDRAGLGLNQGHKMTRGCALNGRENTQNGFFWGENANKIYLNNFAKRLLLVLGGRGQNSRSD